MAADSKQKRLESQFEQKLNCNKTRSPSTYADIERVAMQEHIMTLGGVGATFSCRSSLLRLFSLADALREPATMPERRQAELLWSDAADMMAYDGPELGQDFAHAIFFRVIWASIDKKKLVKVSIGAGGRLPAGSALVTIHERLTGFDEQCIIYNKPCSTRAGLDATFLFEQWEGGNDMIKAHLMRHSRQAARWALPCCALPGATTDRHVSDLVTKLMLLGSFRGGSAEHTGTGLQGHEVDIASQLGAAGMLESMSGGRWILSLAGVRAMVSTSMLGVAMPVFELPPADKALQDCSNWELLQKMQQAGWEWRRWKPKSARSKRERTAIPAGYVKGAPLQWFTGKALHRSYMLALLDAEAAQCLNGST